LIATGDRALERFKTIALSFRLNLKYQVRIGEKIMFGLGWPEVAVIGLVGILIFGPKRIPEMGKALGKTLRGFKEELNNPSDEDEE
jgi:sec-independent protein translocase protein TatA